MDRVAHGRPIPNSLKKGLGAALARFDEYQLAKYRRTRAEITLVDAVNLLHPPHTEALRKLVNGTLAPAETWETKLTQAGAAAESEAELKKDVWTKLLASRKIGYFALLRNLRNIPAAPPELTDAAVALLTDKQLIARSLVMPFRFTTALEALQSSGLPNADRVLAALSDAVDASLANVPRFEGKTLVALDGSVMGRPIKIGALFTATLAKANDADVMLFSNDAQYVSVNPHDTTLTVAAWLEKQCEAGGTGQNPAEATADKMPALPAGGTPTLPGTARGFAETVTAQSMRPAMTSRGPKPTGPLLSTLNPSVPMPSKSSSSNPFPSFPGPRHGRPG